MPICKNCGCFYDSNDFARNLLRLCDKRCEEAWHENTKDFDDIEYWETDDNGEDDY